MPVWSIGEIITIDMGFMTYKVEGIEDCLLQPIRGLPITDDLADEVVA